MTLASPLLLPASVEPAEGALARIQRLLASLTETNRRVAEFILANPWAVRGLSISDLADRTGVSVNTVNRMSRELGYRGYREFAQALALDLGRVLGSAYSLPSEIASAVDGPEDELAVVVKTLALEVQCLQDVMRRLDGDQVRAAVDALQRASAILFAGTGASLALCALAAYRLTALGIRAAWSGEPATIMAELYVLRPGDVLFGVSQHGAPQQVVYALRHARERGVTTVCLTAAPGSPAAQAADICLVVMAQNPAAGSGQFATRVAAMAIVEALIGAVAWKRFGGTPAHVEELLRAQQEMNLAPPLPRRRGWSARGAGL